MKPAFRPQFDGERWYLDGPPTKVTVGMSIETNGVARVIVEVGEPWMHGSRKLRRGFSAPCAPTRTVRLQTQMPPERKAVNRRGRMRRTGRGKMK